MSDLRELYQELIIDHGRRPRNFGALEDASCTMHGNNPLCGDKLTLHLKLNGDIIENLKFEGSGCAISTASSSLMTEQLKGKTIPEALAFFDKFHDMVTTEHSFDTSELGKLKVMAGVREFPARVKCATLAWHTLRAALHGETEAVSTES